MSRRRNHSLVVGMLEQLAMHSPIAVALVDGDLRLLFVNERWTADYRLSRDRVIGRLLPDVLPSFSGDWSLIFTICKSGEIYTDNELPFARGSGETDWVRREVRAWMDESGGFGGLMIYTEIVTQRKRAQEELRAQHRFLRRVAPDLPRARQGPRRQPVRRPEEELRAPCALP